MLKKEAIDFDLATIYLVDSYLRIEGAQGIVETNLSKRRYRTLLLLRKTYEEYTRDERSSPAYFPRDLKETIVIRQAIYNLRRLTKPYDLIETELLIGYKLRTPQRVDFRHEAFAIRARRKFS